MQRRSTLSARGFACVALERPTDPVNVGHALRAALCFQAQMVILAGADPSIDIAKLVTDPARSYRHVPVLNVDDLFEAMPADTEPVAVELAEDAAELPSFVHPERACYVFGPENGSISPGVLARCRYRVMIPTTISLNLGMSVNVVLYDRLAKAPQR